MEPAILTADERFVYVTQDRETYERHWRRRLAEMDENIRIDSAREKGIEQGREEIARNALAEGASIEFVQKITGLSPETIARL